MGHTAGIYRMRRQALSDGIYRIWSFALSIIFMPAVIQVHAIVTMIMNMIKIENILKYALLCLKNFSFLK